MAQSELSKIIALLTVAYPYYFKDLNRDGIVALTSLYMDNFGKYSGEIVLKAVKEIIGHSKFMPSIAEITEECENCLSQKKVEILEVMKANGYFKQGCFGELSSQQQSRNYDKAVRWLSTNIIPQWFLDDMKEYGRQKSLTRSEEYLELEK